MQHIKYIQISNNLNVFEAIKLKTTAAHQQLERSPVFAPLLSKQLSVPEYVRALTHLLSFHLFCEQVIGLKANVPLVNELNLTPLSGFILNDLAQLNQVPTTSICARDKVTDEQLIAVLYVMLGSSLGSQILFKRLRHKGLSCRYYQNSSEQITHWHKFKQIASQLIENNNFCIDRISSHANHIFAGIHSQDFSRF